MKEKTNGYFSTLHGERFYKIENYDQMDDFFMTITSSSDVWNFLWSKGGITAGRINSDHSIFPYYTADKISDGKTNTGSYSLIKIVKNDKTYKIEPFSALRASSLARSLESDRIKHNLYKNISGTKVWFEEINEELQFAFRTGWTSSAKYGLVRCVEVENLSSDAVQFEILDGVRNVLPACTTSSFQEANSYLLDAYKKTDLDTESNLALFAVSSIPYDRAEPKEGLYANSCWWTTEDKIILNPEAPEYFANNKEIPSEDVLKGKRGACYIVKNINLPAKESAQWYQIFDTSLNHSKVCELKKLISDRKVAEKDLLSDIQAGIDLLNKYISESDGIQETSNEMAVSHHYANVLFNIMRGGIFQDSANISIEDFISFAKNRNVSECKNLEEIISHCSVSKDKKISRSILEKAILDSGNPQAMRLFMEYMPLTFSRRHGDPSRPWNRFNIRLRDDNGNPILNYEGNWRDIFQNWEALSFSYPEYIKNMVAKFLNAMTAEGYNPYRISRDGLDWEIPDPDNPWAQIGYWGDHQVIYLEKLLELWNKTNTADLNSTLNKEFFSTSKVPFILKSFEDIKKDPRNSIIFDKELSDALLIESKTYGTDAKLIRTKNGDVSLVTLTAKLIQIVINKAANFVPAGGIWLNTQRPEWNDANNALAGYGLSMVTTYYLRRFMGFLINLYSQDENINIEYNMPVEIYECFVALSKLYEDTDILTAAIDNEHRNNFVEKAELIFQNEYQNVYTNGYSGKTKTITGKEIQKNLKVILKHIDNTISLNKRTDGLYHSYNTLSLGNGKMEVHNLQEMLEGQVAAISSGYLSGQEVLELTKALKDSRMYEPKQKSYMLYPNKELKPFENKNCIQKENVIGLENLLSKTGSKILSKDLNDVYHFNGDFVNTNTMKEILSSLPEEERPSQEETEKLLELYEKTFNHQSFTGRSGTFYAFEGLGSIYWHMVAKLLLAVQERAIEEKNSSIAEELKKAYYDIRSGISWNKSPEIYGAFPSDPYSHTPYLQGAKQPGMTGQVKEEILTRWGELGVYVQNGIASFKPIILQKSEFSNDGKLSFTWCGVPITYVLSDENRISINEEGTVSVQKGNCLTLEQSAKLFSRNGSIFEITVFLNF